MLLQSQCGCVATEVTVDHSGKHYLSEAVIQLQFQYICCNLLGVDQCGKQYLSEAVLLLQYQSGCVTTDLEFTRVGVNTSARQ